MKTSLPASKSQRSALEIVTSALKQTGALLLDRLSGEKLIERKPGRANIVTEIDRLAEKKIIDILHSEYPEFGIVTEESEGFTSNSPYCWIIDPIDGTNNYTFGIPLFCTTVALARRDAILLGVTYDPLRDELFHAEQGMGAFLNGKKVTVSHRPKVEDCLIGYDLGYRAEVGDVMFGITKTLWPGIHGFRIMGSAALGLAYVACGRFDLYFHAWLYPWDLAAGSLMVVEAGGLVTDWSCNPASLNTQRIIASNGITHKEFTTLADAYLSIGQGL
ncbi:MAG: inositol monophosphatase family protein [Chloroflexota bacterium]|nr:inositol monophosphatase family protein [Chloroflexota bacterium]